MNARLEQPTHPALIQRDHQLRELMIDAGVLRPGKGKTTTVREGEITPLRPQANVFRTDARGIAAARKREPFDFEMTDPALVHLLELRARAARKQPKTGDHHEPTQ